MELPRQLEAGRCCVKYRAQIEAAIVQAKSDGMVLMVHKTAERIAAAKESTGETVNPIVSDVIEEAARGGVPVQFTRQAARHLSLGCLPKRLTLLW